jgi:hypothetical protein
MKNKTNRYRERFCGYLIEIPSATNSNKVQYKINNSAFIRWKTGTRTVLLLVVMIGI